ncbi:MAG: hypothetical protein DRR42_01635 [Gammaproteobacteria bacterium]|nr:MAG: hypothetical protein DRR42_01635 [Gammaproteobacteria bacterium]
MHTIKFYPVNNGDCSQILLDNGKRILIDYRQPANGADPKKPEIDLSKTLRDELAKASRSDFDAVIFTHADLDHIEGSTDFFYLEHAKRYQGEGRIHINELWVPAAFVLESVTNDELSNEFPILRAEARHRLKAGAGIKVFSKPPELVKYLESEGIGANDRDDLIVDAGTIVDTFSIDGDGVEFFCHSPYKKHCEDGASKELRNEAALIFNIRFKYGSYEYDMFAVGDSTSDVLADIVNITEAHGREDRLAWNLYSVPHHCSYLALAPDGEKGDTKTTPIEEVRRLLGYGKKNGYIVCSSKPIGSDKEAYEQIQPPHVQSKNTYEESLKEVSGRKFLVTMEEPNRIHPKPLEFKITAGGLSLSTTGAVAATTAAASSTPARAG